jgi:hypothetical protein
MFMKIEDDLTIPHSLNPVANDLSVSPLKTTEVTEISPPQNRRGDRNLDNL